MPRVYALLAGINDYPAGVSKLNGCLNDVDNFHGFLKDSFGDSLHDVVLRDADATRANIIAQFRSHLGQAREGDVAVFQYCGHGARSASAPEFREFFPDGKDEGLVCIDSRVDGGFDLADKELAVLIAEVARENPHLAIILDCCHSGSATRSIASLGDAAARMTGEIRQPRPLETYLGGYYADLRKKGLPFSIPKARHVLLAACQRTQTAKERLDPTTQLKRGVFTTTLVEVLGRSRGNLSYADLFVQTRAAVRTRADDQSPQFEVYDDFNAQWGFLGQPPSERGLRYSVYFENGKWLAECGAVHGMPTDPSTPVALALYPEANESRVAGNAAMVAVGPQKSELRLDFASDAAARYRAEVTSLPVEPLVIGFSGPPSWQDALAAALKKDPSVPVMIVDDTAVADYVLAGQGRSLVLKHRDMAGFIQGVEVDDADPSTAIDTLLPVLKQVAQWERSRTLDNPATSFDTGLVDFVLTATLGDGRTERFSDGEAVLDFQKIGNAFARIRAKLQVRNLSGQTLHITLVYFSAEFGVHVLGNEPVISADSWTTVWGDAEVDYFFVPDGSDESIDHFKLIVSTEKVDDFLLRLDPLPLGVILVPVRGYGGVTPLAKKVLENEWFTKDMRIQTIRTCQIQVGSAKRQ